MTTRELATREQISPAEVVEGATAQARLLMDIVEKTKCFVEISGKKYLQVEAWETIGAFNRTHAETESITPLTKDNETIGYQAHVQLWQDGIVIGGAIMPCYFTENCCQGKEGDAKHKASMSAAQTFATSKAYRMNYSYVAILAGYQPLPSEEVTDDMKGPVDKSKHWCKEHDTAFFKKGKMTSFAHPIEGTKDWCHEPKQAEKDADSFPEDPPHAKAAAQAAKEATAQRKVEEPPSKEAIDSDWLKESLKKVKWTEKTAATWLVGKFGVEGGLLKDVLARLTKEQVAEFVKKIQDLLEVA